MLKRRPLLLFFPLAFLLSWYPYILGKTHLVRTSGGMNPLGVMVAAVVVAAVCYRAAGVKELLGRYLRWRIGWSNYIFALLLPVVIVAVSATMNVLLGAARPTRAQLALWPEMLPRFIFIFLFIGVGEETGWRGFALPELQKRFSPLTASLIIGVIWAAWHIPLMGIEFRGQIICFPAWGHVCVCADRMVIQSLGGKSSASTALSCDRQHGGGGLRFPHVPWRRSYKIVVDLYRPVGGCSRFVDSSFTSNDRNA